MTIAEKLKHCAGCYRDVYNKGCGGAKRCYMLPKMRLILRKEVHVNQAPPWTQKPRKLPSCYSRERFVYISHKRTH
jgi:hypothetical protein